MLEDTQGKPVEPLEAAVIDLEQLEVGTHERAFELPAPWIAEALAQTDAIAEHGGVARLELTVQADRTLLVRGRVEVEYAVPCARCLEPGPVDVAQETDELCVTFVPAERLRSWFDLPGGAEHTGAPDQEDEIEPLEPAELDEIGYEGSTIDLRGLIAEQILLAYPMRVLCRRGEACLGLCMRCGADLNLAVDASGSPPDRCPACGARRDGSDDDDPDASPWKQALAKVKRNN